MKVVAAPLQLQSLLGGATNAGCWLSGGAHKATVRAQQLIETYAACAAAWGRGWVVDQRGCSGSSGVGRRALAACRNGKAPFRGGIRHVGKAQKLGLPIQTGPSSLPTP